MEKKLQTAWQVRQAHFPPRIYFDRPHATKGVSVTGKECALNCSHCGGHYLEKMAALKPEILGQAKSYLISGGCDGQGRVPWFRQLDLLLQAKGKSRYNMHVGLVNEEEIPALARIADVVSFDFVADDATIREALGLEKTVEDYVRVYQALRQKVRVLPHICIGLRGGEESGEERALDLLAELGTEGLVFIVFTPTPGTRYADRQPPPLERVVDLLSEARLRFPNLPIHLGCMRPKGKYRARLDELAIRAGINRLVQPTPGAVQLAQTLGLEIVYGEECCVL
ncbi:hypothetical protein SAMN02745885_00955 [Carboxydocella sporoproducens DSM 16521]|uniref:Elp3/MiaA/NifB-like radical SAM core domain-containing protein n=2 Tax=Carboxydocella TaxID=178898 RepID=A0A1T4NL48_9FIRM|nr:MULTISPECIES: radical SAM protein [Carboxydocella]AVX20089.1 hypothetical protein CFE_0891 [Carboxydocella thermautotrophica]AVX30506.1 hypothetical protein CTH_0906 [Carboxydocella thermautotrophica]SJZ79825.1 hypothetical protein SAMN02745885_00955 [Carboxydocella sporoproducens DSM 16521]